MAETRFFHVEVGRGIRRLATLAEALLARSGGGYIWIDVLDPTRDGLDAVARPLGIHALAVEDCLDEQQIPKIEDYPTHALVLFNRYDYGARQLAIEEVDLLQGTDFLVTVSRSGPGGERAFANPEALVGPEARNVEKGPDFLLHVILDYMVDGKLATIEALEDDIEAAEEGMLEDAATFRLQDLVSLRRALLSLRKSLFHEREILVKICRKDSPFISESAIYHFRDIYDHLTKFFEFTEMNRDILTSLTETYLSLVNNRMADVANRTNRSVRRLTLITTVFMPLTLLAGVGGMSEWSMMTGPHNWRVAYPLFIGAMAVIGAVNYALLRWVERRRGDRPADDS